MNLVRPRRRERPAFARGPWLSAAAVCVVWISTATLAGCDSGAVNPQLSGGGSLGTFPGQGDDASSVAGDDATTSSGATGGTGGGSGSGATPPPIGADDAGPAGADAGATPADDAGADDDAGSPSTTTLTLLDTNVNTIVDGEPVSGWDPIPQASTIDVAKVGDALSIRANTTPPVVTSVTFVLDGTYTHTELVVPYTMCGDDGKGDITPCPLTVGAHTLVVTPAIANDAGAGAAGTTPMPSTTLHFEIVDSSLDAGVAPDVAVTL